MYDSSSKFPATTPPMKVTRMIALIIMVVTMISVPSSTAIADHGNCNPDNYSHIGAYRTGGGGFGARATLEWDSPPVCLDFSTTWPMSYSNDTGRWVQGGWFHPSETDYTEAFFEWVDQNGGWHRYRWGNVWGTGSYQFAVYRNFSLPAVTWCFSVAGEQVDCTGSNLSYPKDEIQFYAETPRTQNRLFGSTADPVSISSLGYRTSDGVWHSTTAFCFNTYATPGGDHYRGCTPKWTEVGSFGVWDDRR